MEKRLGHFPDPAPSRERGRRLKCDLKTVFSHFCLSFTVRITKRDTETFKFLCICVFP